MYDVDGNGFIDLIEMTKIVKSIYNMMGPNQVTNKFTSISCIFEELTFGSTTNDVTVLGWRVQGFCDNSTKPY